MSCREEVCARRVLRPLRAPPRRATALLSSSPDCSGPGGGGASTHAACADSRGAAHPPTARRARVEGRIGGAWPGQPGQAPAGFASRRATRPHPRAAPGARAHRPARTRARAGMRWYKHDDAHCWHHTRNTLFWGGDQKTRARAGKRWYKHDDDAGYNIPWPASPRPDPPPPRPTPPFAFRRPPPGRRRSEPCRGAGAAALGRPNPLWRPTYIKRYT